MTDPSLPEVMREVQRLVKQVEALITEVRVDYVRKELYEAKHANVLDRLETVEREADERERDRKSFQRQILAGFIIGLLLLIANIFVAVLRTPGVGS